MFSRFIRNESGKRESGDKTAVVWIRDGVLLDRMPVNAVAFAYAFRLLADRAKLEAQSVSTETLINFAFEKSGISARDKMLSFNAERCDALSAVDEAVDLYNDIATEAGKQCSYFPGAVELLDELHTARTRNFVSSAIDQALLNEWLSSAQGSQVAPALSETLGRRENFSKGKEHFQYIFDIVGAERIIFVADAISEIRMASALSAQFNLISVGFAHEIRRAQIVEAATNLLSILALRGFDKAIGSSDYSSIVLPSASEIAAALRAAGADYVVEGEAHNLIPALRSTIQAILKPEEN